jgi:hypothetical protein
MIRLAAGLLLVLAAPKSALAQAPELDVRGLLRTGFRAERSSLGGTDGFALYDARLGVSGRVGIVFDYRVAVEVDTQDETLHLLDASLATPLKGDELGLQFGLFPSPFGREATTPKGDLGFVERSQSTLALAPGRQVGAALYGRSYEGRLRYGGGLFNGDGRRLRTADDGFLAVAQVAWNSIGDVEFFEDFVWEVGASAGIASDSAEVLPAVPAEGTDIEAPAFLLFDGNRTLLGVHGRVAYREWSLSAEYLRAVFDPRDRSGTSSAEGWHAQISYALWGGIELLARWDDFRPPRDTGSPERSRFLVFGINLLPGLNGRLGAQYAIGVNGTDRGVGAALDDTNVSGALTDGQFLLSLQVNF